MENRPVISFNFQSPYPGTDPGSWERSRRWGLEVWAPVTMRSSHILKMDVYSIVGEHPEYPVFGDIDHYRNLSGWQNAGADYEPVRQDIKSWSDRKIAEHIWSAAYALVKGYRSKPEIQENSRDTIVEDAPIIHVEAYNLSQEQQDRYASWFIDYGCPAFVPLFMKQAGLVAFNWYEHTGLHRHEARESAYPKYLTLVYFENPTAYETFAKSPELAACHRAMRSVFPKGLGYQWYVQYQLIKSFRK